LLIGSIVIFIFVGRFFIPKIPELVHSVLDINIAQDKFYIASLHWFGGFSVQLSFLLMFVISTIILCVSLVTIIRTLYSVRKHKTH